jgi:hypothetical protein
VHAAVNIGVVFLVVVAHGVDDGARLLAGGAVVQVCERVAVDLLVQDREVLAHVVNVEEVAAVVGRPGSRLGHCTISLT